MSNTSKNRIVIPNKLPQVGTTIFTTMSKMANDHGALNLSQGFPDFPISERLIELVYDAMKKGMNQYAPMPGLPALREQLAIKVEKLYNNKVDPDEEITITSGATEAINAAITAVVEPGDEVIIFDPAYDCYTPTIELCHGVPIHISLQAPDYRIDFEELKSKINEKTKMVMINSPHNPTGTIIRKEDLEQLDTILRDTNIFLLSDEVYEHLIYDEEKHESVLKYPGLYERSFVVFSFGKVFHATGWKMGYCIAPPDLTVQFRKIHQFLVFSSSTPMQAGLAEFLKNEDEYLSLPNFFQKKRDTFAEAIKDSKFKIIPCHGTYFQLLDYSAISDERDVDYAKRLVLENGIASIPVSVFYKDELDNNILRFCFAKNEDTLLKAAEILCKI